MYMNLLTCFHLSLSLKTVLYSEELAKKIRDNGLGSREAQEKAINCEISALRAAFKCILCHSLQSEYSPDLLRARIVKLQRQMADLRIPNQHSGFTTKSQSDDRYEGTPCAPISQVQKAARKKRLASDTEGVTVHESLQQQQNLSASASYQCGKKLVQILSFAMLLCHPMCNHLLNPHLQMLNLVLTPNYSKEVFSQPVKGYSADDQICDSGQAFSQLLGGSHAYDDAKVETGEPVLPVQASCHAAVSGKMRSHNDHSDHSVIASSVPQSLSLHINPFYHPGKNLMPKLQELLSKLKNSLPCSGKTETPRGLT